MSALMNHTFPKSTPMSEKYKLLLEAVRLEDNLGIIIDADPDAMASALALKRIFWRKARKVMIFHINSIQRADNLAFIKLLKVDQKPIRQIKRSKITKWAIVDSQPRHHEEFKDRQFDIIIDHHSPDTGSKGLFVDIREHYGANSTIMTEYLRAGRTRPSPVLATALFYGIKTDTDNFARESLPNDINAFRYLYKYANTNIIRKIEFSEMSKETLDRYRFALKRMVLVRDIAFVHMGEVKNPDILVIIADFFMRLAEATWSIVSGIYEGRLIVTLRNGGFRGNAGKVAQRLFGSLGGSAGGHRSAARAEIPLEEISKWTKGKFDPGQFIIKALKKLK